MSNDKFAGLLRGLGVAPPHKISPATGKKTYAFAKTDEGFKALQGHEMYEVQALVAARLGNKSTLEETRTQRFIDIAKRGNLPIPLRYYAAHTGRWGGSDKINIQNLPSRGPDGKTLKQSLIAPENHMLIDCDSSQIEARVLAWLAGQNDLLQSFANKEDVYIKMASRIYNVPEEEVTKDQRFVGKTTILGAGYGMGAVKFKAQLKNFGFDMDLDEARRVINIYRAANAHISTLWHESQVLIENMVRKTPTRIGTPRLIESMGNIPAITLPSGLLMRYPDLRAERNENGVQYTYKTRNSRTKIYGGKFVENVCQAVARCIIAEQMLKIASKYKVVLTVHDSIVVCVHYNDVDIACEYVEDCMREVPVWAEKLPLDCESGVGKSYGECE
jgi:DNA polymerase